MYLEVLLLVVLIAYIYHYYSTTYWKRKNVVQVAGEFVFGSIRDLVLKKETMSEFFHRIYNEHKSHPVVGFYSFYRPMLMVNDPKLIHQVLIKDFNKFYNNGFRVHIKVDPMFGINPFVTPGLQRWKFVRSLHLPLLTPMKLKEYVSYIIKVGTNMTEFLKNKNSEPILVKDLSSYYTIDNVASCAYGCEPTAFTDPENGFTKHASYQFFTPSIIANLSALFFPKVAKYFRMRIVSQETEDFFVSMVKSVINFRVNNNVERNDIIGHLIKLNAKMMEEKKKGFTDLEFAGHSMTFYVNGFETSSSQLSFMLLEVANRPDVQEQLRNEIFSVGQKFEDFDYDKVNSMEYLGMVLDETLRMHPLIPILSRESTERVQVGDVVIEKGTKVFIPVVCLHKDPNLFPDPYSFVPERFAEKNKDAIVKCTYLPFGEGPRKCLGFRFAKLQLKLALVFLLMNFKILPGSGKEKEEIIYEKASPFVMNAKYDSKLKFELL